jgi:transposase
MRTRAVELLKEGYTQAFISKILKVGTTSIKRWKNVIEENGSIQFNYKVSNRTAPKLPAQSLKEYIEANDDALLKEIASHFDCTPQAVFYACERNKITYKKKSRAIESVMNKSVPNS